MSNALATAELLAAIKSALLTAFPSMTLSYGEPLTAQGANLGSIIPRDVDISRTGPLATMGNTHQTNVFSIWLTFPWPDDPTARLAIEKVTAANSAIAVLQVGGAFGGYGVQPLVSKVSFDYARDTQEQVYDLMMDFEVWTQASH